MVKYIKLMSALFFTLALVACNEEFPIDEDGLLITTRTQCYVSNFEMLGSDFQTVRTKAAVIDTVAQTVNVEVTVQTLKICIRNSPS